MTAPTFAEFFAGIGGFRIGLERSGFRCVYSCEIDPFARRVYAARFGHEPEGRDILELKADDIPDADVWCGGFPCQDLSVAGKRCGFGGERSVLAFRFLELVAAARPKWLILENVPGMLSVRGGGDFGVLLAALDDLGFRVAWRCLDARYFGVAQRRRRVFLVCGAGDGTDPFSVLFEPEGVQWNPAAGEEAWAGSSGGAEGGARNGGDLARCLRAKANLSHREDADTLIAPTVNARSLDTTGGFASGQGGTLVAWTLLTHTGRCQIEQTFVPSVAQVRRLTPTEAERLMGFPDGLTCLCGVTPYSTATCRCKDGARYRVLGNAVVPNVVAWVGRRLRAEIARVSA